MHGGVGAGDGAGHRDHEAEGELGDGDGVGAGGVHDDDAAAGGGSGVDVVDAYAGAADDAELRRGLEQLGVGLHGGADDEGVGVGEFGGEAVLDLVGGDDCQPGSCWKTARVAGETFSARTIFMLRRLLMSAGNGTDGSVLRVGELRMPFASRAPANEALLLT